MDVVDAFRIATDTAVRRHPHFADPALMAARLSWAVAAVLDADGAGLSLSSGDVVELLRVGEGDGRVRGELTAGMAQDAESLAPFVNRIALGRPVLPADIAPAVLFLASDAAAYITGAVLPVDGGTSASTGQPHV